MSKPLTQAQVDMIREETERQWEQMYHPLIVSQTRVTERRYYTATKVMLDALQRKVGLPETDPDVQDLLFVFGFVVENRCEFCAVEHKPGGECENEECPG